MDDETPRIVIPEHIETATTDSRGRLTLGSDFADKLVTVAVVKTEEPDD